MSFTPSRATDGDVSSPAPSVIKVAVLTPTISRKGGGLLDAVRRSNQELDRDVSVDVRVLTVADEYSEADQAMWAPLTTTAFPSTGPVKFGYSRALARAVAEFAPDVVHVHGLWHCNSIVARNYSRRTGRPHVVSPHGMLDSWALEFSARKKRLAAAAFERTHLYEAACLHALCEAESESIRAYGIEAPICVIPNGVDLPIGRRDVVVAATSGAVRWKLLFLGRLHPQKGVMELLHGWAKFASAHPNNAAAWELVIAGWSQLGYEESLRSLARELGITGSVSFTGPLYGEEKETAFTGASAFILPSKSEGLPMVVLEAWARRLPVLMTDECHLPEGFAAGGAFRIEPSPSSIADGLLRLSRLTHEERQAAGARGRLLVEQDYSWATVAHQFKRVYEWLLGRAARPHFVRRAGESPTVLRASHGAR